MARPPQEAIDTFVSITGADEVTAVRVLEVTTPARPLPSPSLRFCSLVLWSRQFGDSLLGVSG
jgi:hypothetical protein